MAYFGNEPAKVAVKVGSGVITATELADDSITTADIIDDAITPNQLDEDGTGFQVGTLGIGAAVSGGHALLVSGTSSISGAATFGGAATFTGDLYSSTGFRTAGYIKMNNAQALQAEDSGGTQRELLKLSSGNVLQIAPANHAVTFGTGTATFGGNVTFGGGSASDASIYKGGNNYLYVQGGSVGLALKGKNSDDVALYLANSGQEFSVYTNDAERLKIDNTSATFAGTLTVDGTGTHTFDGDLHVVNKALIINQSQKFYLDGGGDTYLWSNGSNQVDLNVG